MPTYTVLNGKHWVNINGTLKPFAKGETVELPKEVAESFPGRFALVEPAAPPADEGKKAGGK